MTQPLPVKRIVVLFSGSGTNLQAILDASKTGDFGGQVVAVLSNRPDAGGLQRARQAGLAPVILDHRPFSSRAAFDQALMAEIDRFQPDLVVLAGFMRILSDPFVRHYRGRMLNIHPSLLPRYPGLRTHQRALEAGDKFHGATVHFVTEQLDGGPPVVQVRVPVKADDSVASLSARVLEREHEIYPAAIHWFCTDRLELSDKGPVFDGQLLIEPVRWREDPIENPLPDLAGRGPD